MDFMADQLFNNQRIRGLTIVDTCSKISPAIGVGFNYKGCDVVEALEQAVKAHGCPGRMRLDNGPEFLSRDLDLWAYARGVVLDLWRPGKPTDNAFSEAFNSRVRLECLNQHWFLDIEDARAKIEAWRQDYNTERPHGAIGNQIPMDLINSERSRISSYKTGPDIRYRTTVIPLGY